MALVELLLFLKFLPAVISERVRNCGFVIGVEVKEEGYLSRKMTFFCDEESMPLPGPVSACHLTATVAPLRESYRIHRQPYAFGLVANARLPGDSSSQLRLAQDPGYVRLEVQ